MHYGPIILVDADILVYRVACSVECPIYVVGGGIYKTRKIAERVAKMKQLTVKKRVNIGHEHELRKNLNAILADMYDKTGSKNTKFYITASKVEGNFRAKLATILPYKGNRTKSIKPVHYRRMREILVKDYGAIKVQGQEADDAISIEATRLHKERGDYDGCVIASIDKDLRQIPGLHFNMTTGVVDMVTEEQALKNFYTQLLVGDVADNIPGLSKLLQVRGMLKERRALSKSHYISEFKKLIEKYSAEDTWNYVLGMYEGYGFGEKELDEIGNLLYLRRYEGQIWSEDR